MTNDEKGLQVRALYGWRTREPLVEIELLGQKAQMSIFEAREHAQAVLECAEAAETDGFIWEFFSRMSLTEAQIATLLQDFRAYREEQIGKELIQTMKDVMPEPGEPQA
jgi:hypothetical protein